MRILFLGAGAIGGYYGRQLAQAGADVAFLVRPGRATQLEAEGLGGTDAGRDAAATGAHHPAGQLNGSFDAVMLTCKAYDLPTAIEAIAPAVGPASVVVPLLNGLAHLDALDARFGAARVLGGVAYIAATLMPDGTINHTSPMDTLLFGDRSGDPSVEALSAAFAATPVAAKASTDILQDLWEKWCMLAAGAAITCLLRGTIGEVLATEDGAGVASALVGETRAIAAALGHAPRPPAIAQAGRTLGDPQSGWAASMMRDIQQGASRLEAEHIIGDLIRRGRAAGVEVPMLADRVCPSPGLQRPQCRARGMISLHQASVPPCLRALASLAHVLAKGEAYCAARGIDPVTLLRRGSIRTCSLWCGRCRLPATPRCGSARGWSAWPRPSLPDTEASFAEPQQRVAQAVGVLEDCGRSSSPGPKRGRWSSPLAASLFICRASTTCRASPCRRSIST